MTPLQSWPFVIPTHSPNSSLHNNTPPHTYTFMSSSSANDVVISGLGCRFPESSSPEEFWDNLINGVDMVTSDDRRWVRIKNSSNFHAHTAPAPAPPHPLIHPPHTYTIPPDPSTIRPSTFPTTLSHNTLNPTQSTIPPLPKIYQLTGSTPFATHSLGRLGCTYARCSLAPLPDRKGAQPVVVRRDVFRGVWKGCAQDGSAAAAAAPRDV